MAGIKVKAKGTKAPKAPPKRKAVQRLAPWQLYLRRAVWGIAGIGLVFWLAALFIVSDGPQTVRDSMRDFALTQSAKAGFAVADILVEGRVNTDSALLFALLNVEEGMPILGFNPWDAKAMLEKIVWVDQVSVERRLPDTIYIALEERVPLARWQKTKGAVLLDTRGQVINIDDMARFDDLILLKGGKAPEQGPDFLKLLAAEPMIHDRTTVARLIEGRRWDLRLNNDIIVKLPETDPGLALSRLRKAQEDDKILDRAVEIVDVRKPERIVIRVRPGEVQNYKTSLKGGH